jgi:ectoine hydrolase
MSVPSDTGPNFSRAEFGHRLGAVHRAMEAAGIDCLLVSDPSNMAWLTGYDGWSFYVHQCVIVPLGQAPIWYGRAQDMNGARLTVYMGDDGIAGYDDHYVQSPHRHPMEPLCDFMEGQGLGGGTVGVEMDNYYFSAAAYMTLQTNLANATFKDATGLVNWCRAVKSEAELAYMRRAGRIVAHMHARIAEKVHVGMRKCDLVADIYDAGIRWNGEFGGDYPAIVPLLPSGAQAGAPHLTWDDRPLQAGQGTFFEIAGCYKRYHCPLSRTVYLGKPPARYRDAERAVLEGLEAGLEQARAGNLCEDIANAFFGVLRKNGITKNNRAGYPIGISYPPDWGERTMSLRPGDTTVLQENMTFHFMTGLWQDDWGLEITESFVVGASGPEMLADYPREILVRD